MAADKVARASVVVNRLVQAVAVAALLLMVLHIIANALLRHVANSPLGGTNEYVAHWYLPVVVFLGIYLAQRHGSHIEARLVFDRLPRPSQVEIQLAGQLITAVLAVGFAYYGWIEAVEALELGLTAGVINVSIWPIMFVVPAAFVLLIVQIGVDATVVFRNRRNEVPRS